jgi:endonuclease/exonuclease/phosphatase family metal-dependent hydrolase
METALTGSLLVLDFRQPNELTKLRSRQLKCVQWNIERGYKLDEIIQILIRENADIICLQELDIGCERSRRRDCVMEIARALNMKCAFLAEFEEIHSPLRSEDLQGGGVHGNAILSLFDFDPYIVDHKHHPMNWERDGHTLSEPRRGQRAIIAASVTIPWLPRPIICYSLHLEVFCGLLDRLKQFADVLEDANARYDRDRCCYHIIMGDLNTMAHGIARLSSKYCLDIMRFWSIGYSEGSWWKKHVLDVLRSDSNSENPMLLSYAPKYFSKTDLVHLRNNYYFDPFDIDYDVTLSNYGGYFTGKLDWIFLRGFQVLSHSMGNLDYAASDHRLLRVAIEPLDGCEDPGKEAYNRYIQGTSYEQPVSSGTQSNQRRLLYMLCSISCVAFGLWGLRKCLQEFRGDLSKG